MFMKQIIRGNETLVYGYDVDKSPIITVGR